MQGDDTGTDPGDGRETTGVQQLIDQLREEGVEQGRSEAQRLIDEAKREKRRILDEAEREAQRRKDEAQHEIDSMKRAAHDALHQAARDTVLALRQQMFNRFQDDVRRLVSQEIREAEVVKRLILAVGGRAGEALAEADPEQVEIVLPREAPGLDELRKNPEALRQDELMRLVLAITGDRLREGLTFRVARDKQAGLRVVAHDHEIEFDLSEQAMAELILEHLQPRFRALLDGLVG
ncbi:V/A-type H+-transporting ATPase subunit E [Limimonas halophila]|uniref:V/A-type H+-transporting ATPase subunit E n=1 Tax=Limimonas halophila TaxID=1082479 RepID=A0A1G7UBN6_9PROT|nr:hypothetical protein [Limimonas halophila]SDG44711.1 V/A-type H+-transporting ATPase subunit E [Limimonas halophila]